MENTDDIDVAGLTTKIYGLVKNLDPDIRARIIAAVFTLCGQPSQFGEPNSTHLSREPSFGDREDLSPKDFVKAKAPKQDIERVACLAYYLTHYRDQPHFKTLDLSRLNTAAAQLKLSNAAQTVKNASKAGLLADAGRRGVKQLSQLGEDFVAALPDRDAAKKVLSRGRRPRKKAPKRKATGKSQEK